MKISDPNIDVSDLAKIIVFILTLVCTDFPLNAQEDTSNYKSIDHCNEVFSNVEEMPYFKQCDNGNRGVNEKFRCSQEIMLEYLLKNIHYPMAAEEDCLPGLIIIQFVVDDEGELSNLHCLQSSNCPAYDKIVLEIIGKLDKDFDWVAGRHLGKPVCVRFKLPLRVCFKSE